MATKPVEIEILLKDSLSAGLEGMQRKLDVLTGKAAGTAERMRILDTAIGALNVQLAAMKKAGEDASPDLDQTKNIAAIEQVEAKIKELQARLKALDETAESTDTVPRGTEQAVKQYNGLHMSIQQIAREMPSLAMGPQMFFLAISNNLPVFTDELARARKEYDALVASGQKGTPVWKQVLSSLFSWQTALTTAIMLLVMYSDEILDWVKGLFTAKNALDDTRKAQEEFNAYVRKLNEDWRNNVAAAAGENIAAYRRLAREYNDLGDNMDAKRKFITDNRDAFHDLGFSVNGVTDAENLFVKNTDSVVSALVARARAAAYEQEITDATRRYIKQTESNNSTVAGGGYYTVAKDRQSYTTVGKKDFKLSELASLTEGVDYENYSNNAVQAFVLTASGAAKINAQRRKEAADRLKKNNDEAKRQLDSIVSRATEGIRQQTDAERTVYDSLGLKPYDPQSSRSDAESEKIGEQRKKTQEELNKDLLALQRQNQDDETALMEEGTAKKLKEIDNDYKSLMAEIDRQEAEFKKKNREAGTPGLADGLTRQQQDALKAARDNAGREQERRTSEVYLSEARAMRDYLKEYGTFQQQKLAIAEEYAEKINKAQTEGERLSLTAERDRSLQQVEINAIRQDIDWGSVFGEFGTMFKEQLRPTIDRLRAIAQSETFKQSGIDEQQTLYELINRLEQSDAVWDSDIFKRVSDDINAYQSAMQGYVAAVESARKAEADYVNAQNAHDAAVRSGNSDMIQATQAAVDETRAAYMDASGQVNAFGSQVQGATADLNSSALQARSMFEDLAAGLRGLTSGSLQGIGNGAMQLDKLFGGKVTEKAGNALAKGFQSLLGKDSEAARTLTTALGDSGLAGEIISAILGVLDMLAQDGVGGIVSNLVDTVLGSVGGVLDDIFSGGIITKPLQSVVNGVGNILNTLTFGGLGSWLGGNDKEVMETVDRLTESNEYLKDSIDGLTERIGKGDTTNRESMDYYNDARKAELEWEANQREIIKSLASAWTNTGYGFLGLGGKGSFNKYAPGSGWEGWDAFTETLRRNGINITVNSTGDLWNLTPEQMALLRDSNPAEWQHLFSGDGHKNPQDAVDEYIERAGTLNELTGALNEKLTGYSWDGFLDKYKEMIKDAETTTEDFADFIGDTVGNALIESFVNEELKDDIKELYDYIADAAADGISAEEKAKIEEMNEAIAKGAMSWRDAMVSAGMIEDDGGGTTQSGKSGSFNAMGQEQGTKLEGMFTSGLMHWSSMDEQMQDVSSQMGTAVDHLRRIEENTGNSARHLGEIKEDIKKIIRDGLKMK